MLSVYVTLLDSSQKDASKMIVCQKNYRFAEPFAGKGPAALAQGMSRAMEKVFPAAYCRPLPPHSAAVSGITRPVAGAGGR